MVQTLDKLIEEIIAEVRRRADIITASPHGRLDITWQDGVLVGITPAPHFRRERPKQAKA